MGVHFDWQIDEDPQGVGRGRPEKRPGRHWLRWLLIVCVAAVAAVWGWGRWQIEREKQQTRAALQAVLDEQTARWQTGRTLDFLDNAPPNAVWQAEQFRPENIAFWEGGPLITDFERQDGEIWANVTWEVANRERRQRALFFEERPEGIVLRDSAYRFWGTARWQTADFGEIRLYEPDLIWRDQFISTIEQAAERACGSSCPPLDIEITSRWSIRADRLTWPSPRIWGLTPAGEPTPLYWEQLSAAVTAYLAPPPIVFAVPAAYLNNYREVASKFTEQTGLVVELVAQEQWANEAEMLAAVDGAALTPSLTLIQQGRVLELTDLVYTDIAFDTADYYEQLWQGGFWRERMWMLPQSASMTLIYFEPELYRTVGRPYPTPLWTWDELWADGEAFLTADLVSWALATPDTDWLYSLAYNAGNRCTDSVTINCSPRLRRADVATALETFAVQARRVPFYAGMTPREVAIAYQNEISLQTRRSAVWVDEPLQYEQNFLSRAARVVPYPGSGDFPGVTPLWVDGFVISAATDAPQAVWQWLSFLSHNYLVRTDRHVPARPSVATREGYWTRLPQPLGRSMIEAFPYARPVLLTERNIFTEAVLAQVASGELTPEAAAARCASCAP